MEKSVIILGGGLAGLASAVFLSGKGFHVSVYESAPKWGGRTYSYFDKEKNIFVDNGVHVLAGFYENTFEYMKLIGTYDKLDIKKNLELILCDKNKNVFRLKCGNLPGVFSLLSGIFKFKGFTFKDKIRFLKVRKLTNKGYLDNAALESISAAQLLDNLGQTDNLKKFFWNPLIYASFNTTPENVSADLLAKLIIKGTENKKNMSIILGKDNLNGLFVDNALNYLKNKSVILNNNLGGNKINLKGNYIESVELDNGNTVSADYYVCAVPFFNFEKLFSSEFYVKYFNNSINLKTSTIISVHLFFNKEINLEINNDMIGLLDTTVQWVFINNKKHISLVISGADFIENNLTEKTNEEIYKICMEDLKSCLTGFDENNISDFKVIKEKRATFLPEVGSEKHRFNQKCNIENLFIAGDWTDTGLPSTIEGAVKSARICTDLINNNLN
jgi:squalene-associated FAD-dependent desaturase